MAAPLRSGHLIVWLILMVAIPGRSQPFIDILKVEYAQSPGNRFITGDGESTLQEWTTDISVPVRLSPANVLLTGFLYERFQLRLDPGQPDVAVSTLNLKLGLNHSFNPNWSATVMFLPKISSDLTSVQRQDVQFGVAALAVHTRRSDLVYKFGALYNSDLFGPFFTPLLGMYLKTNRWEVNALLPAQATIHYAIRPPFHLGIRFNGAIRSFHMYPTPNRPDAYLARAQNDLGAYLGVHMGHFYLTGMVGYSIGRSYRIYERDDQLDMAILFFKFGDQRNQLNTDFDDGLLWKLTLHYRLSTDGR